MLGYGKTWYQYWFHLFKFGLPICNCIDCFVTRCGQFEIIRLEQLLWRSNNS